MAYIPANSTARDFPTQLRNNSTLRAAAAGLSRLSVGTRQRQPWHSALMAAADVCAHACAARACGRDASFRSRGPPTRSCLAHPPAMVPARALRALSALRVRAATLLGEFARSV